MVLGSYIDMFFGAFINLVLYVLILRKVFDMKPNSSIRDRALILIITNVLIVIINIYNRNAFKALFTLPVITLFISKMYSINYNKSFIYTIFSSIYILIGEIMCGIIFSLLPVKYSFVLSNVLGCTIGNEMICITIFPFIYIKSLTGFFKKTEKFALSNENLITKIMCLLLISAISYRCSLGIENLIAAIMNVIIFIIFSLILYNLYIQSIKRKTVTEKYDSLLEYLDQYELEIENKSKLIHDYKNQLIVIDGYADDNNIKLKKYVKSLIDENINVKDTCMIKNIDKLPKGLKGLVCYKVSHINTDINFNLEVSKNITFFDNLDTEITKNILNIIGILIDNAIEASMDSIDKYVELEIIERSNELEFNVINSIKEEVDISKINNVGYSTKGKDRGYGLSIVNDIIKKNDNMSLELSSNKIAFTASYKIKL